jgi:putative RNA 2'-phosphotransferase
VVILYLKEKLSHESTIQDQGSDNIIMSKSSRYLSLLLRHKPEEASLDMDKNGWVKVKQLLKNTDITMDELIDVVENNNKKRFIFNDSQTSIRANQGHSVKVDVELKETEPPEYLYHGTASKTLISIYKDGIKKMNRNHVHLSIDEDTATNVGSRHGKPIILKINTKKMYADGIKFYLSENDVWLTDFVDSEYFK